MAKSDPRAKKTVRRKPTTKLTPTQKKRLKALNQLVGIGKGIWDRDAQEYVNELRGA
jgi:hypothetical protein